jgi:hypothetical protein
MDKPATVRNKIRAGVLPEIKTKTKRVSFELKKKIARQELMDAWSKVHEECICFRLEIDSIIVGKSYIMGELEPPLMAATQYSNVWRGYGSF